MEKHMKILYDHQIFSYQKYGGISRLHTELIQKFMNYNNIEVNVGILDTENHYLKNNINFIKYPLFSRLNLKKNIPLYCINAAYSRKKLLLDNYDIFHPTYYNPYFLQYLKNKPYVITVHDMTHEIYPEFVTKRDYAIQWKRKAIQKAKRIIAVSENTKKDLLRFYNLDPEIIDVIYLGNSLNHNTERLNIKLPESYILYVGSRDRHKNFGVFLRALKDVCNNHKDLHILCVGGSGFTENELQKINNYHLNGRIHLLTPSDSELGYIYTNAKLFVFPSLYEGFGIPILEAFSMGCPIILSNSSCFPEIAGDAGVYFNPEKHSSLQEAIETVLVDTDYRDYLIKKAMNKERNSAGIFVQNKHSTSMKMH